jgi:hypothetical protein
MSLETDGQPSDVELDLMEAGPTEIPRLKQRIRALEVRERALVEVLRTALMKEHDLLTCATPWHMRVEALLEGKEERA